MIDSELNDGGGMWDGQWTAKFGNDDSGHLAKDICGLAIIIIIIIFHLLSITPSSITTTNMSTPTLIIYGATSFTARQLLLYLDTHPDSSQFEFILAGRNAQKLESLNEDLLQTRREVIACDLDDGIGVKRLVEQGQVVVNLAGMSVSHQTSCESDQCVDRAFLGPFRDNNAEALIR